MVLWWPREILMGFFTSSHCLGKLTEISTSLGVFWMNCVVVSHSLIHSIFGKHNLNTVFSFVWTNGRNDAGCRNVLHLTRWDCLLRNLHEHGFISMLKPFVGRWLTDHVTTMDVFRSWCRSKECVHLLDYQWQCHIDRPNKSKLT